MKTHVLFFTVGVLLLTTNVLAQKKATPKAATKKAAPAGVITEASANKIISMTNSVIDIYNSNVRNLSTASEALNRYEQTMANLKENPNRSANGANCSYYPLQTLMMENLKKNAALTPSFAEKNEILGGINYIDKNIDRLTKHCSALNDYFNGKQYKEDKNYSKYPVLLDSLVNAYVDMSKAWKKTITLSSDAGDRAEIVLLKKSPIADAIIPMKTDLKSVLKIMTEFREEKPDYAAIVAAIEKLQADIETSKKLSTKGLAALQKRSSGERHFNNFYEVMNNVIESAKKTELYMNPAHEVKEKGEDRESAIRFNMANIKSGYESLVDEYNSL